MTDEEFKELRKELDEIRMTMPPKWTHWFLALLVSTFIGWSSWITLCMIRMEGRHESLFTTVVEHRALPLHPGASEWLKLLEREIIEMRADIRTLTKEVQKRDAVKP